MRENTPLYLEVYSHIVYQIFTGKYRAGEKLPSKKLLCRRYHVGDNTIRMAEKLLVKDRLIKTAKRKAPVVIFDVNAPSNGARLLGLLERQHSSIEAHFCTFGLLAPSLLEYSAKRCTDKALEKLKACLSRMPLESHKSGEYWENVDSFMGTILGAMDNSLVELAYRHIRLGLLIPAPDYLLCDPFYTARLSLLRCFQEVVDIAEGRRTVQDPFCQTALKDQFTAALHKTIRLLRDSASGQPQPYDEFTGFRKRRDIMYARIYTDIMEQILRRQLPRGTFLPTESQMRARYKVSSATVRKAYRMLNDMGIAKTMQGKGTMVTYGCDGIGKDGDSIREMRQRLRGYFQALQFLTVTCIDVVQFAQEQMTDKTISSLCEKVIKQCDIPQPEEREQAPMILLDGLVAQIDCCVLNEIYLRIKKELFWGIQLKALIDAEGIYLLGMEKNREEIIESSRAAAQALQLKNTHRCARLTYRAFSIIEQLAASICEKSGILEPSF